MRKENRDRRRPRRRSSERRSVGWVEPRFLAALAHRNGGGPRWAFTPGGVRPTRQVASRTPPRWPSASEPDHAVLCLSRTGARSPYEEKEGRDEHSGRRGLRDQVGLPP